MADTETIVWLLSITTQRWGIDVHTYRTEEGAKRGLVLYVRDNWQPDGSGITQAEFDALPDERAVEWSFDARGYEESYRLEFSYLEAGKSWPNRQPKYGWAKILHHQSWTNPNHESDWAMLLNHPHRGKGPRFCQWCEVEVERWAYPPFCSLKCLLRYAKSAWRAGYRKPVGEAPTNRDPGG